MKETFFFSHDYNARHDPRLIKLLMVMGPEGKGLYWDIIEMMYEQNGYLELSALEIYAFALRTTKEKLLQLINDFELFSKNETQFFSKSVLKRLELRKEKSKKASKSARIKWSKEKKDTQKDIEDSTQKEVCERIPNAERTQCECNAIKENVVKESKGKENVVKEEKDTQGKTETATDFSHSSKTGTAKDKTENGNGSETVKPGTEDIADSSATKQPEMSWSAEVDMAVDMGIEQNLAMRICNLGRSNRLGFTRETYSQFVGMTEDEVNKTLDVILVAAGKRKSGAAGLASVSDTTKFKP